MENKLPISLKELIFSSCSIMSVSGFEGRGKDALNSLIGEYFDRYETDAVGNHYFYKYSVKENAPTVLVDAHFDEIGFIVTEMLDGGFLRITSMGGVDPCIMQASDVVIYASKAIRGVVASIPPHLTKGDEKKLPPITEMLIDTGLDLDKDSLAKIIPVGTPVGFPENYGTLSCEGENGEVIVGKSFDDKACGACAAFAIINTPKEELAANVCLLFSSYEETSRLGGVSPATYRISPDYAMVIDVNLARVPDTKAIDTVPFAKGISISVSAATDRRLTQMTRALCEEKEIPFCIVAAPMSTGTNAASVNLVREGVPVVDVGLPLKNMHTYNEVVSMKDAQVLADLVKAFICSDKIAESFGKEMGI
jgi:endoglucanase